MIRTWRAMQGWTSPPPEKPSLRVATATLRYESPRKFDATCIAFSDSRGNTALLFSKDVINATMKFTTPIRKELGEKYGLPISNILIAATWHRI